MIKDWKHHEGEVNIYGDATGGAPGSAKVKGSDWDLVEVELNKEFKGRLNFNVPRGNPAERARINSVNSRLKNVKGKIKMLVDPVNAKHTADDLDAVMLIEGGSGEIDKKSDKSITHLTDGVGYYVFRDFSIKRDSLIITR